MGQMLFLDGLYRSQVLLGFRFIFGWLLVAREEWYPWERMDGYGMAGVVL